ncbi:MAG: sugar ABC transporter permease [Thermomicrobiales bacterium]|nr:sugar ABC transporter permease [Thermomicrobiales bacterium]
MQTYAPGKQAAAILAVAPRRRLDLRRVLTVVAFLLPAASVYSLFVLFPLIQAGYYGLYRWKGLGPLQDFVRFGNFERILQDEVFRRAVQHNLVILALSVTIQLPIALGLALLVRRGLHGRTFFRTVFFLPYVLSEVVTGLIWTFIYHPQSGINDLFAAIIPGYEPRGWLGEPSSVLLCIFVVITWKFLGFHFILYLAGLQSIPPELEEAALIDGASGARAIRDVTIPLLGPTIRLSVFLSVLGSLQFFDLIWVMTTGGPVNASETMATYMYKFGFQRFALGYGAAVSLVIFAICLAFSVSYQRFVMRRDYAGPVM